MEKNAIRLPAQRKKGSKPTAKKMFEILHYIAKKETKIETQRAVLARHVEFEPRQAFQRVARDYQRMEASDIQQFIARFTDEEMYQTEACHYLVRYWNEHKSYTGLGVPKKEEGYLSLTDFAALVLPQENEILRATATQRETFASADISYQVERQLAVLLQMECDLQETYERMKSELESVKGFSTAALFKQLDRQKVGFIDKETLAHFMFM